MAKMVSATDLAIALAHREGTLEMVERTSRFGDTFIALSDAYGLIEVQPTWEAAQARVTFLRDRVG